LLLRRQLLVAKHKYKMIEMRLVNDRECVIVERL
jgi:hypothetical protein